MGRIAALNEAVAVRVTLVFGTMWTTYVFFLYGFLPLLFPGNMVAIMYWSSTVQLWALPLIMVGQNVLGRANDRRDQAQYEMVQEIRRLSRWHVDTMKALMLLAERQEGVLERVEDRVEQTRELVDALDGEIDGQLRREEG